MNLIMPVRGGGQMVIRSPFKHQVNALNFAVGRDYYALLMEQGTGKTPVIIWDAARRWMNGTLNALLVLAPNGVHANWTLREIPQHMPSGIECVSAAWYSGANKREQAAIDDLFSPAALRGPLRILTMNWESLITKAGFAMAKRFGISAPQLFLAGDESQRFKNPNAQRTRALMKLRPYATQRAILSGTAIVQSPWDAFSQFGFLHPSILQTKSYVAFKAEYAELLPAGHGLLRHIMDRHMPAIRKQFERQMFEAANIPDPQLRLLEVNRVETLIAEEVNKRSPQMVARDPITGRPKWRNLEKLNALIEPHSFRVLKSEALDLPAKVYTQRYFRMTGIQRRAYDQLKNELRLKLEDGTITPVERIAAVTKLSQVVSGYFIIPGTNGEINPIMPRESNPKIEALMDELEDGDESVIIWARFHNEIRDICRSLSIAHIKHVEYHGGISQTNRQLAIDAFQTRAARVFVGQQQAGGTGITLTAASSVIYYSNTWSLEDRLQSEDRAHRIGQTKSVRYVDILAQDSIDDKVVDALRAKTDLARIVMGDAKRLAAML